MRIQEGSLIECENNNRKQWRRDHPFGFYARPHRNPQGALEMQRWECGIPGKSQTLWDGGLFKLDLTFPDGEFGFLLWWLRECVKSGVGG